MKKQLFDQILLIAVCVALTVIFVMSAVWGEGGLRPSYIVYIVFSVIQFIIQINSKYIFSFLTYCVKIVVFALTVIYTCWYVFLSPYMFSHEQNLFYGVLVIVYVSVVALAFIIKVIRFIYLCKHHRVK